MSKAERIISVAKQIKMLQSEFESLEVNLDEEGGYVEIDGVEIRFDSSGLISTTFNI